MALELYTRLGNGSKLSTAQVDENFKRIKAAVDVLQSATSGGIGSVTTVGASVPTGLFVNVTNPTTTPSIAITTNLSGFIKGDGTGFSAQPNVVLNSGDTSGILPVAKGGIGTNGSGFIANRILEWNGTTFVTGSASTSEITYLTGVTSNIQTQLNGKEPSITLLPISKGGTALGTTPSNGQILIGNGTGYSLATITAGSGVSITNGAGTITIASSVAATQWTTDGSNINYTAGSIAVGTTSQVGGAFTAIRNGGGVGIGTWIQNSGTTGTDAAYFQARNANNSQIVTLQAQGQGSSDRAYTGTTSNSPFAIRTNDVERAVFTNDNFILNSGLVANNISGSLVSANVSTNAYIVYSAQASPTNITLTLPQITSDMNGKTYIFKRQNTGGLEIACNPADAFDTGGTTYSITAQHDSIKVIAHFPTLKWVVFKYF